MAVSPTYTFAVLLTLALSGVDAFRCSTDFDCSLSGKCLPSGQCKCKAWAKGEDCAAMNLAAPASAADIAPLIEPHEKWTRWGGSVIRVQGTVHMFSSEMANECGLNVWGSASQVIHSTSTLGTTGFKLDGLAVPAEAHNAVISQAADGTFLLWTCGCPRAVPTPPGNCTREKVVCAGGKEAAWTTTVYSSTSVAGPWIPHVNILGSLGGEIGTQNVSPLMLANGTVVLMFKGPDNNTEASLATAPHWKGPYTMLETNIFAKYFAAGITNEDCWLWEDLTDNTYHMLSHRMTPADRETDVTGGHGFSKDLVTWHYAMTPAYTNNVTIADGSVAQLTRRERPQLLLDETGTPTVLYNAMVYNGQTFTGAIPFATSEI